MGTINLVNSLRYDMHGRKRKTNAEKLKEHLTEIKNTKGGKK